MKKTLGVCLVFLLATTACFAQSLDTKITVTLKGRMVNVGLPDAWRLKDQAAETVDASRSTAVFVRENPKAIFDITVSDLEANPNYKDLRFQRGFLDQMKGMLQKSVEASGYLWLTDEISDWFGGPALVATYVKDNKTRQVVFIKNDLLHIIDFACSKDEFDKQWSEIEKDIRSIEFL